ncbi:hypothetical protein AX769_13825 [Frondihabitans sp. PAMC 28766]|uniref:hypothetical protein n=1 Tax=Frondihabitans sp. PAMC 28766 TaxID=1795630 RepID=UPI00078D4C87|nr:hypothetical protein [Frondihabitans sp. PAMC 28766]AMM21013.1 hypothetical protein AX769_13825 [Frondihabitans sp. PAMC 28766]
MTADSHDARKRPIRPPGAPPRPGLVPDDETVVRPRPVPLPKRVRHDDGASGETAAPAPLVAERFAPTALSALPAVPALASSLPVAAPVRAEAPAPLPTVAPAGVLTHHTIGAAPGRLDLADPRWSTTLASRSGGLLLETRPPALPELDEEGPARRLTHQPAFIASMAAALVVVVVVVVLVLMQTVFRGPDRVENLQLLDGGDNYVLQWSGPDVPYDVLMTGGSTGKNEDVSALVKGGRSAWIPKTGADVTDKSCFIVRGQRATSQKLPTTKAALAAQGAARICVSAASSGS